PGRSRSSDSWGCGVSESASPVAAAKREYFHYMLRGYWFWCLIVAAGAVLAAGCRAVPSSPQAPPRENSSVALKREMAEERALGRTSEAHAHYARGVIHEMNDEQAAASEEYNQAALADLSNDFLVLEVSRRFLENKQPDKALELVTRAAA